MPPPKRSLKVKYGLLWNPSMSDLDIAFSCVRKGGEWKGASGKTVGAPLFVLYREIQTILWPDDDHHVWSDLMLREILANRITAIQGPKDCGKTHTIAKFALTDYFCFPTTTLILMSSTDIRGLELRVWGDLKDLFIRAKEIWPEAPGYPMDSLHGIFTNRLEEIGDIRDLRKGIICIPCLESGGQWKGLEKYTGIKQKRRRLLGDEVQFMQAPYLASLANLNKNDFKGVFVGNPIGDGDPLDKLAEPEGGWDALLDIAVTTTWDTKMGGRAINLVGLDSPAIANPAKYPYLINQSDIDYITKFWGKDSAEYWNQAAGVRRPGVSLRRVVTREMAAKFGAMESVVWRGLRNTRVYAIDASYGGDRCVGGWAEFGMDLNGNRVLVFDKPVVIPIVLYPKSVPEEERILPEDQIAKFVMEDCERLGIPPQNVFFDSTGRGSLGTAFARLWSAAVNPVEFGGVPTQRPVCSDLYIIDDKTKQRRLKRADEHYSKRVTEFWFSLRYAVEGYQIRSLPQEVLDELAAREWTIVKGDKIELEAKEDTKKRLGRSPDMADWSVIIVEGARRLGFVIAKMEAPQTGGENSAWREELRQRAVRLRKSFTLDYTA